MNTLQKLEIYKEVHEELKDFAEEYIREFVCTGDNFQYIESVEIDGDKIEATYEEYWSGCCGGYETHSTTIPLEYFTNPDIDWRKIQGDLRLQRNLEAIKKREEKEAEEKRKKEEAEYKKYMELREKFDKKSPKVIVDLSNTIEFADGMDDQKEWP